MNEHHRLTHAITLASPRPCGVTIPARGTGISRPLRGDAGGCALPLDVTVAVWRWVPALSRVGRGAAHPLGNPQGKRTFLMPDVTLRGFGIFLTKRFQGLRETRTLISFSERDVRLISAAFSLVQEPGEGRGFSVLARS